MGRPQGNLQVLCKVNRAGHKGEKVLIILGLDKVVAVWLNKCKGFVRNFTLQTKV
jgi:hypothetical protein